MRRMYTKNQLSEAVANFLANNPSDVAEALDGQAVEVASLDASGLITGGEIIEKMSGYSMALPILSDITLEPVCGRIVKNGNALTIEYNCKITRTASSSSEITVLDITIPEAIGQKLSVGVGTYTIYRMNLHLSNASMGYDTDKVFAFMKMSDTTLRVNMYGADSLTVNEKYLFHFEVTVLLSDNLLT